MKTAIKMNKLYIPQTISYETTTSINFGELRNFLSTAAELYPNFDAWFNFKFRRQLATSQRKMIIAHDGSKLAGVSLLKCSKNESKISTLFVAPEFRNRDIGQNLIERSLSSLNSLDAFITVAEERQQELSPLLVKNGFRLSKSSKSLYRQNKVEQFFQL